MSLEHRILFVDDEPALLESFLRQFRGKYALSVAGSGRAGLEKLRQEGPFAVVVTDLRMPVMDGVAFLDRVRQCCPDTVRMMLTGHADLDAAVRAVNQGQVFRFLSKPCQPADLERALNEGLRQYQLIQTEREYYHLKKMQDSLAGVMSALVRLVEIRDPYTAGHQTRVALLAAAVAQEMGLSEDKVDQISLAATIHDIGKIYVPAEFLCKPGKLLPVELDIVRMHPQIGHDILEPIDFSFPIHQIVLQHHERLDGSGYPHGLRGPEVLLEAKVIAVADVVEAISSHRPYRPSLGLEVALEELERQGGRLYDQLVVSATLDLLRGGDLSFWG
jgi:putative two-component system response regulator